MLVLFVDRLDCPADLDGFSPVFTAIRLLLLMVLSGGEGPSQPFVIKVNTKDRLMAAKLLDDIFVQQFTGHGGCHWAHLLLLEAHVDRVIGGLSRTLYLLHRRIPLYLASRNTVIISLSLLFILSFLLSVV